MRWINKLPQFHCLLYRNTDPLQPILIAEMVQSIIGSEPFKDISESTSEEDQRQDYQTILNVLLKHIRQLQIDVPILESVFAAQRLVDGDIETFLYLFDVLFFLTKDKEDEPQLQEDLSCFHKTLNVGHFNQDNQQEKCSLFRIEEALINFSNLKKKRFEEEIQLNKCDEMYKDREQEKEAFITPFQTPLFARLIRQTRPISLSPAHSLSISNSSILEHELEKGREQIQEIHKTQAEGRIRNQTKKSQSLKSSLHSTLTPDRNTSIITQQSSFQQSPLRFSSFSSSPTSFSFSQNIPQASQQMKPINNQYTPVIPNNQYFSPLKQTSYQPSSSIYSPFISYSPSSTSSPNTKLDPQSPEAVGTKSDNGIQFTQTNQNVQSTPLQGPISIPSTV